MKKSFDEKMLRKKLGIPDDARRVILIAESSHWDPDWLFTARVYYNRFVEGNLDLALSFLQQEPRRIYSIECIYFLKMYWDRKPAQRRTIRQFVNEGRLRLTSSGMTTADTLVPRPEAILRDFLVGQEWLQQHGMTPEPCLAYFPDSFGYSHALPALLNAAGFDRTAITRMDGMYFTGCEFETSRRYPKAGSSAEVLQKKEKTLDFYWCTSEGAKVLCHWNAFTYGQGDMLAHDGINRVYIFPVAFSNPSESHVARRIQTYIHQLMPISRTPYMFCPIGFDFVPPIPNLVELLDRYNRNTFPVSGVWVVNAGLDDYLDLVECHADRLPRIKLDPNPYWTGFYTSRPSLKRKALRLMDELIFAEQLELKKKTCDPQAVHMIRKTWESMVVSNHHDFITGTSPDTVAEKEQHPLLDACLKKTAQLLKSDGHTIEPHIAKNIKPFFKVLQNGDDLTVHTPKYDILLNARNGGSIQVIRENKTGKALLHPFSAGLVSYKESGGLWRMGCEFPGGMYREVDDSSRHGNTLFIESSPDKLMVRVEHHLKGADLRQSYSITHEEPFFQVGVEGMVLPGYTVCIRFNTHVHSRVITMDEGGGVIERAWEKGFHPTYWPFQQFAFVQNKRSEEGCAFFSDMPGAIRFQPNGVLEAVAIRNATHETALGFIKMPGMPIAGHERNPHRVSFGLVFTQVGDWRENNLPKLFNSFRHQLPDDPFYKEVSIVTNQLVRTDSDQVQILAVKSAWRGDGIIIRLQALDLPVKPVELNFPMWNVQKAWLCDARERDIQPIAVHKGNLRIHIERTITTLRILA
jgi:hypothetical protein